MLLNKIFVTSAICLAQYAVLAQDDDMMLTTVVEEDMPDGPLGTEVGVGEEVVEEDNDGVQPVDEMMEMNEEEDHDHDHAHDHDHLVSKACLLYTSAAGAGVPSLDVAFDHTEAITTQLMAHHSPYEYYVCIDKEENQLTSLQLIYANDMGEERVSLPMIGPDGGEDLLCGTFQFSDRGTPVDVRMFEYNELITGMAITYPNNAEDLVTIGAVADITETRSFEGKQSLAGFKGYYNEDSKRISELQVIIQNTECTEKEIEEMVAMENLTANDDDEGVDAGDSDNTGIIIAIIVIVVVIVAIVIVGVVLFLRKRSKKNTVTFFDNNNQPPTQNNSSQGLPEMATEDNMLPSHRSESKNSDRQMNVKPKITV